MARVLVVDDDRNHLRVMKGLIEQEGVDVVTAPDVDTALSCIDHAEFDVIITDSGVDPEVVRAVEAAGCRIEVAECAPANAGDGGV